MLLIYWHGDGNHQHGECSVMGTIFSMVKVASILNIADNVLIVEIYIIAIFDGFDL
jgi:hypothetical protein